MDLPATSYFNFLPGHFLQIRFLKLDLLLLAGMFFIGLVIITIIYIFFLSMLRERYREQKKQIKEMIEPFISNTILRSMETGAAPSVPDIPAHISELCRNKFNRKILINELILVRKNFSGEVGDNIRLLYEQLGLHKDSEEKLKSYKWHIKAKGIQELSLMQQKQHWKSIYKLTNNSNEHVRMEAQAAIIRLTGFVGLRFLNEVTYQITEWQQVNLLRLLQNFPAVDFKGIERWLKSSNTSVVVFALKLAAIFRRYELHDLITECLSHQDEAVRLQAIKTLGEIYQEDTHIHIIKNYRNESLELRLNVLRALGKIASEEAVPFLVDETNDPEQSIRMAASRALVESTPEGYAILEDKACDDAESPWAMIAAQLKNELRS